MTASPGWLVVNADDFGVSRGTTLGVVKAHREGIVSSASLCVTTDHFEFAVGQARQNPALGIGLHFTLTSGRAAAESRRVPLLANSTGHLHGSFTSLFLRNVWKIDHLDWQIEEELEAQLAKLDKAGIKPDHINGERHIQLSPLVFAIVVEAARKRGIPFVRAGRDIGPKLLRGGDVPTLALNGGLVKWRVLADLTKRARRNLDGVASADEIASYMFTGRTASYLPRLLALPPSVDVTEVMVHPALPDEDRELSLGNRELERYVRSADRRAELDACIAARGNTGAWQLTTFAKLASQGSA